VENKPSPLKKNSGATFLPLNPSCRAVRAGHWHKPPPARLEQNASSKIFFSLIEKRKWARAKFKKVEENFA